PAGALVEVFVNGVSVGTTVAVGGVWTLPTPTALAAGQSVTAVAALSPLPPSKPSAPVGGLRRTAPPTGGSPPPGCATHGQGTSTEPDGTVIVVLVDGVPMASATVTGGRWSADVPPLSVGDTVTATAQAPGAATSVPSDGVPVLRRTATPTVQGPIAT